jgi:carbamate kinase
VNKTVLIAIGGNSLIRPGQQGTIPEQFANARLTAVPIVDLVAEGYRIVLTHGNGPQVGAALLRSEAGLSQTYGLPLDICVAMTQGEIGYILQTSLLSALRSRGLTTPVTAIVTQVVVSKDDPAFAHPTKPVGPFYSRDAAERKRSELGWNIAEDADRGYRRVVASPAPCGIVELDTIHRSLDGGAIVIAAGGGGIPVIEEAGGYRGVEAVIDKDRVSSLLATKLKIPTLIISTEVEMVYINYRKPGQQALQHISLAQAKEYFAAGHFAEGSMRPKVQAAVDFLENGGEEVIITNPERLAEAMKGSKGTRITLKGIS